MIYRPLSILIAVRGQALTQWLHATHIRLDSKNGASKGSSCSRRFLSHSFEAGHVPLTASHTEGSHLLKSTFAYLFKNFPPGKVYSSNPVYMFRRLY
jgi:hypothetical protein